MTTPAREIQLSRDCPDCGAPNPRERLLCGVCGRDLDREPTAVWLSRRAEPEIPVSRPGPRRRGRRLLLVAALAFLAVLLAVAVLWAAGVGPFARGPLELPRLEFPAQRYSDEPVELALSDVGTLTVRPPTDGRSFGPEALVDDDVATAWHSDPASLPEGAHGQVDLNLEEPAWVTAVVVANGDQRVPATYAAAGRARRVELGFDGGHVWTAELLDLGRDRQVVELDEPVLTTDVRIAVTSVVEGEEHAGVAISELSLLGHAADEEDAELARERAAERPAGELTPSPAWQGARGWTP